MEANKNQESAPNFAVYHYTLVDKIKQKLRILFFKILFLKVVLNNKYHKYRQRFYKDREKMINVLYMNNWKIILLLNFFLNLKKPNLTMCSKTFRWYEVVKKKTWMQKALLGTI